LRVTILRPRLIIGAGRLGTTLALALERAGRQVSWVASRGEQPARELLGRLRDARVATPEAVCERAGLLLITTPDDAVRTLAAQLQFRPGQAVVHCSGALGLDALERARAQGAQVGCLHPIQTFPERFAGAELFSGIAIGVEASGLELRAWLNATCSALGGWAIDLGGVDRARYHCAAVLASNYVIALHEAAAHAFELAGLPREVARAALSPLTLGTARATSRLPLESALTGPIARGDVKTVERHLAALRTEPELHALYRALGARLLNLPLPLPPADRLALAELLQTSDPER